MSIMLILFLGLLLLLSSELKWCNLKEMKCTKSVVFVVDGMRTQWENTDFFFIIIIIIFFFLEGGGGHL